MPEPEATTKGTILRSLWKFVNDDLSSAQMAAAMGDLPASDRPILERKTLPSDKISEFILNRLTVAAAKAKGESVESFGRRAGRAELADAVGVYRFLTVVLTPTALLRKASSLWSTVHSHGQLMVENESAGSARIRLTGFPSQEAHCARLTGWFEGAAEMTRARNPRIIHGTCIVRGDADCQWLLSWGAASG
jgi:hypothetical protein